MRIHKARFKGSQMMTVTTDNKIVLAIKALENISEAEVKRVQEELASLRRDSETLQKIRKVIREERKVTRYIGYTSTGIARHVLDQIESVIPKE